MPDIQVLSAHVADLIAAGEVVERPASVAKELVENAIDAGATSVTVEIQRGGMALLRVQDNGCGIPWAQCETAFLRHATSKLHTEEELGAISTLGFRGEALAAISAVARVELFTRTAEETLGTGLTMEGGTLLAKEPMGCPLGTTLVVRDLFYNTPARLKFMKRDAAEGAAVFAVVQSLALSHPEVAVKFIRDGKQEMLTPGDGQLRTALYAVLGRDLALGFLPVQAEGEEVTVSGFVSQPSCCRGSRSYQHFFVNGRQVKSRLLVTALEKAYENLKMVGKYPGCALQVQVRPNTVDVNVHPAKTEVKFLSERKVFDGVYYGVLSALTGQTQRPTLPTVELSAAPSLTLRDSARLEQLAPPLFRAAATKPNPNPNPNQPLSGNFNKTATLSTNVHNPVEKTVESVKNFREVVGKSSLIPQIPQIPKIPKIPKTAAHEAEKAPKIKAQEIREIQEIQKILPKASPKAPLEKTQERSREPMREISREIPQEEPAWRLIGEAFQTYLLVEQGDTLLLIDKHAAHERMNFDRMKAQGYEAMAQPLITPAIFTPSPREGEALLENLPLLARFGFVCEDFGDGAVAVREIPADLEPGQAEQTLCELAGQLISTARADPTSARDALLRTMACKAAIKGGQKNSREELLAVARAVVSGQVQYCPHGRPVAITLTRGQLEKQLKRT